LPSFFTCLPFSNFFSRKLRLDGIARRHLAEAEQARAASKTPDFAAAPAAYRPSCGGAQ
jgi:hypothetical protein